MENKMIYAKHTFGAGRGVLVLIVALMAAAGAGCTGVQTFGNAARAGDTISVSFGYGNYDYNEATRENTEIKVRDSAGVTTVYKPGDPRVKAIINMYPDPASYLVVASETGQDIRSNESTIASYVGNVNSQHKDWRQLVAFIDLPDVMATGNARVTLTTSDGTAFSNVNIIEGVGSPHTFDVKNSPSGFTSLERLQSLERSPHHVIRLAGTVNTVQALDVVFTHDPDADNGGSGKAHVVNPRGDITSVNWSDTGSSLHVLVTPTKEVLSKPKKNLLFYVSGGITGLQLSSIKAVDINGNTVPDVGITISPVIYSFTSGPLSTGDEVIVSGDALCNDCGSPDTDVWVKVNDNWTQVTPFNVSSSSCSFTMPEPAAVGDDLIVWVGVNGGIASKNAVIE
jgi:hypothetical protein